METDARKMHMNRQQKMTAAVMAALLLAGCSGRETDRMMSYIQGYLDLTYRDMLDEGYAEITGLSKEDADQQYEDGLDLETDFFIENIARISDPTDEIRQEIHDMYARIYSYSSYTVDSCSLLSDGSYSVTVTVHPIDLLTRFTPDDFNQVFIEVLNSRGVNSAMDLYGLSKEDYAAADQEYAEKIIEMISDEIDAAGYSEARTASVKISEEGDAWEMDEEDITQIDTWIIDYSTFGYE